jgi:hypothetical protein
MSDDVDLDDIGSTRVRFWVCPIRSHRDRLAVTVEWRGSVAHCTAPGCTWTSTTTTDLAAAEAKGRQWARDTLRDTAAYELWVSFGGGQSRTGWPHESHGPQFADYLEAMATEEAGRDE